MILLFFSVFFFIWIIIHWNTGNKEPVIKESNTYWQQAYWEKQIDKFGPEKAYDNLKLTSSRWAYLPTHQALHAFGFALYSKYKQDGIKYCDDFQRFGCFHGVLASLVSDQGLVVLDRIDDICPRNEWSVENKCFHGVGHGLVDYLGRSKLNSALSYCEKIGSLSYLGCPQGALMEYYAPINTQSKKMVYEKFTEKELFGTCSSLDEKYQKYCYFFIPSFYWPDFITLDPVKSESYCGKIENIFFRQMCLVNIGVRLANSSNFNLVKSKEACLTMKEHVNQLYCLGGVKWNSGGDPNNIKISANLCSDFDKDNSQICDSIGQELNN